MRLLATDLPGVHVVEIEPRIDERGLFARTFCAETFRAHGLDAAVDQCNLSFNARRGTLRGLHYQAAPAAEAKLVRCTRGAVFDVAVDLRRDSPTAGRWLGLELTAANRRAVHVPPGVAHGFITLEDDTELVYQMSVPHAPDLARGVRWDDPALAIAWPLPPTVMSERDRSWPDLDPALAAAADADSRPPPPAADKGDRPGARPVCAVRPENADDPAFLH